MVLLNSGVFLHKKCIRRSGARTILELSSQQPRQQRGSRRQMLHHDGFMASMSSFAHGAHPSSVGMPRAEVKLPSEAPPVEASSSANPNSAASALASSKDARFRGVRSIGGRLMPPVDGQLASLVHRFERGKSALHARAVGLADDAAHPPPPRPRRQSRCSCSRRLPRPHSPSLPASGRSSRSPSRSRAPAPRRRSLPSRSPLRHERPLLSPRSASCQCLCGRSCRPAPAPAPEHKPAALRRQPLGRGPRSRAAHLLVARQQQHDLAAAASRLGQHLEGGEGHGHAGLHVQRAGPPEPTLPPACKASSSVFPAAKPCPDAPAASFARWLRSSISAQNAPPADRQTPFAGEVDAPAQRPCVRRRQRDAGVHGRFLVRRRLSPHQFLCKIEQRRLFAPRPRQQRAHRNGNFACHGHFQTFPDHSGGRRPEIP